MKAIAYTAVIAATLFGAAAHADQGNNYGNDFPPPAISTTSGLTRAQVLAELAQAKANGGIVYDQEGFPDQTVQQASKPADRAQVRRETRHYEASSRAGGPGEYPANL
ncbi:DUF4148 domain-containing protein [Pigmentiphaga sp.]|uniref:DUF4148 domain-containing protein n=1 Tax=Pigmentiphaga sp. TaxID=1977564 RepID=UPI00128B59A1|nr:DUF4148 domain-containing protein [Pigmentiphaga sp.]MPS30167.1 DUF4148 domain-containing protein [Alcaligenaceae bacterium SAGV5]MPS54834.1 DUF4148 domain-containing protein [Alcaligenaceae bacterium SAGV3]MPT55448.1 DUF4148 domain-containing protein [Alcaligenaceae bacterium]